MPGSFSFEPAQAQILTAPLASLFGVPRLRGSTVRPAAEILGPHHKEPTAPEDYQTRLKARLQPKSCRNTFFLVDIYYVPEYFVLE